MRKKGKETKMTIEELKEEMKKTEEKRQNDRAKTLYDLLIDISNNNNKISYNMTAYELDVYKQCYFIIKNIIDE